MAEQPPVAVSEPGERVPEVRHGQAEHDELLDEDDGEPGEEAFVRPGLDAAHHHLGQDEVEGEHGEAEPGHVHAAGHVPHQDDVGGRQHEVVDGEHVGDKVLLVGGLRRRHRLRRDRLAMMLTGAVRVRWLMLRAVVRHPGGGGGDGDGRALLLLLSVGCRYLLYILASTVKQRRKCRTEIMSWFDVHTAAQAKTTCALASEPSTQVGNRQVKRQNSRGAREPCVIHRHRTSLTDMNVNVQNITSRTCNDTNVNTRLKFSTRSA